MLRSTGFTLIGKKDVRRTNITRIQTVITYLTALFLCVVHEAIYLCLSAGKLATLVVTDINAVLLPSSWVETLPRQIPTSELPTCPSFPRRQEPSHHSHSTGFPPARERHMHGSLGPCVALLNALVRNDHHGCLRSTHRSNKHLKRMLIRVDRL